MKPLYLEITPFFPTPQNFKGAYVYDQVAALKALSDYELIVIKCVTPYDDDKRPFYTYQGIHVYQFVVYELPSSILPSRFLSVNTLRLKRFIKEHITKDFSSIKALHAHVINPAGMLAYGLGKELNLPFFIQHHGLDVFQKDNGRILRGKLRELNYNWMVSRYTKAVNSATLNIGVSQKVLDALHTFENIQLAHEYVLYNGVDSKKFFPLPHQKNSIFHIGCIANFWPLKDHMTLIKALHSVVNSQENILLHLIGSGPTKQEIESYIAMHHLERFIQWHEEIDHSELNSFYNTLDLFVLPSYYEALGCVYTEAMHVGVPIIAVKGQGIEELIYDEQKEYALIDKGDTNRLATLILWHIEHPKREQHDLSLRHFITPYLDFIKALI